LIYFFKYDLGGANWEGNYTIFNMFSGAIQILSMMLFFPFLRRFFEAYKIFFVAVVSSISGYIILLVMALSGVNSVYPFFIPGFFIMAAVGILNVLCTIFLANTVDYGEVKNNRRDESVIFSMQTFVVKLASGIAALVAAISLAVFKISESNSSVEAIEGSFIQGLMDKIINLKPVTVNASSVFGLRLTMTLTPIFGLIIAIILFKVKFILNEKKMREITRKLKQSKMLSMEEN
jgi:Na+/melibiose symporter-like transporter